MNYPVHFNYLEFTVPAHPGKNTNDDKHSSEALSGLRLAHTVPQANNIDHEKHMLTRYSFPSRFETNHTHYQPRSTTAVSQGDRDGHDPEIFSNAI